MSVEVQSGTHFPKNSMMFEFDEEVISVFDNMARRSIVGYDHAYQMIEYIVRGRGLPKYSTVWDMGTTTGRGLRAVKAGAGLNPYVTYHGVDISKASCDKVKAALPWAKVHEHDLTKGFPHADPDASCVIFGYTLQFIQSWVARTQLIQQAHNRLMPGGMLFVLEKYKLTDPFLSGIAQDAYIQFRVDNGYSLEEIKKKSEALANSMWPETPEFMETAMKEAGFSKINLLYRELNFGGYVAFKD